MGVLPSGSALLGPEVGEQLACAQPSQYVGIKASPRLATGPRSCSNRSTWPYFATNQLTTSLSILYLNLDVKLPWGLCLCSRGTLLVWCSTWTGVSASNPPTFADCVRVDYHSCVPGASLYTISDSVKCPAELSSWNGTLLYMLRLYRRFKLHIQISQCSNQCYDLSWRMNIRNRGASE